jgi:outer membrane protein W
MSVARGMALAMLLLPAAIAGQVRDGTAGNWRALARLALSGKSHASTPEGYEIYSGLALEAAIARRVTDVFAVELSVRTESREVEGPPSLGDRALGSLEMIPANLTVQWRPLDDTDSVFQPYAGAGFNLTAVWEKSGALDSTDSPVSTSPVGQLGGVIRVGTRTMLTMDVKWHAMDIEIEGLTDPIPRIEVDPLTLGIGLGFSF